MSTIFGLTLGAFGLAGAASSALTNRDDNDPQATICHAMESDDDCMPVVMDAMDGDGAKVTICHATNSETNPYNKITVSVSAVTHGGHRNHTGPVWYPGAKDAGVRWGDIIPPTDGVTAANWPSGESTFNNNCELPGTDTQVKDKGKTHGPKTTTAP